MSRSTSRPVGESALALVGRAVIAGANWRDSQPVISGAAKVASAYCPGFSQVSARNLVRVEAGSPQRVGSEMKGFSVASGLVGARQPANLDSFSLLTSTLAPWPQRTALAS